MPTLHSGSSWSHVAKLSPERESLVLVTLVLTPIPTEVGNNKKTYYPEDLFCANIIRDIRISCVSSSDFEYVISVISSH